MAIEQAHAIPIMVDGVIGLSHGHGHIIYGYWKHFSPTFSLVLSAWLLFKKKTGDIFSEKTKGTMNESKSIFIKSD